MLINYPILPTRGANESDDAYFDRILQTHVMAHEGRYPVSRINTATGPADRWHGGVHLHGGAEPLRAIADGLVVAFRMANVRENYEGLGEYDTSFVLLRHDTESGENTRIRFYSLYMHLANRTALEPSRFAQLPQWLRQATPGPGVQTPANQRVWCKDVLGFAGQLYGRETCHFEVFALEQDVNAFWRDSTNIGTGTGSADFFGDAHFVIPRERAFSARHPRAATTGPHRIDFPGSNDFQLPVGQAGTNQSELYVSVRFERGRRITTTCRAAQDNTFVQVGQPVVQDDYEYELYRLSKALYPDCPAAGLEWLRFGRLLTPGLTTNRAENWQLVRYADGAIGYIDLALAGIARMSDADFPHWQGWERRVESQLATAGDGVCDDPRTLGIAQLDDAASRRKLRHLICRHPSEWDASDLAHRYARLRQPGQPLHTDASWTRFEQQVQRLTFWQGAGLGDRNVWHFHPLQFIRHYRKCEWMSLDEMTQMIPRRLPNQPLVEWDTASERLQTGNPPMDHMPAGLHAALNRTMRKYLISSPLRKAHFFGQVWQETGMLRFNTENGDNRYFRTMYEVITPQEAGEDYDRQRTLSRRLITGRWPSEVAAAGTPANRISTREDYVATRPGQVQAKANELGNTAPGSGPLFRGRGLIQLTGHNNYASYGEYVGQNFTAADRAPLLAGDASVSTDVAGKYWVNAGAFGGRSNNRRADAGSTAHDVEQVTRAVNGGTTHLDLRRQFFDYTWGLLNDAAVRPDTAQHQRQKQ